MDRKTKDAAMAPGRTVKGIAAILKIINFSIGVVDEKIKKLTGLGSKILSLTDMLADGADHL